MEESDKGGADNDKKEQYLKEEMRKWFLAPIGHKFKGVFA